jgi:serine O-acetyltransferase
MTGALHADIRRYTSTKPATSLLRLLVDHYGLQAVFAYRLGRRLLNPQQSAWWWPLLPLGWLLYYVLSRYVRLAFDIRLELSAEIGPGLYIGHFGGVRVRGCRIGAHCSIGHLTEIAPADQGPGPIIGDSVWMGVKVRVIGPWHIGPEATVSAGAVVLADIPRGALCMGNPARIILPNYDNRSILGAADESRSAATLRRAGQEL